MKNNSILIIFLCTLCYVCQAQTKSYSIWQPKIIDLSGTPLETANISINKNVDYPVSKGLANIPLIKVTDGDSIFVSCMGYNVLKFAISRRDDLPAILKLTPISFSLKEVEISKSKRKFKEIVVGTNAFSISNTLLNYNSSYGLYINNNDNKRGYIKEVRITMFNRFNGIDMPFKLRLYKKTPNEPFPKEELMEPMVVYNLKKKKKFDIDISHLGLRLPENGFFIVFEVLGKEYYNDKKAKSFGFLADELPSFGFTTFPKSENKLNYSIQKLPIDKNWIFYRAVEYQFQAKILLDNE